MPKTAHDKHRDPLANERDIRRAVGLFPIHAVAAHSRDTQGRAKRAFRRGIA
jgi:hypothetical protein